MRKKIQMSDNFLNELYEFVGNNTYHIEWRTSSGCVFQDMQKHYPDEFIKMTPESIYNEYKKNPNKRFIFSLVGNHKKWYSRGMIKNIYADVTSPW